MNMKENKTSADKCHNNPRKNAKSMAEPQLVAENQVPSNVDGTEINIPTPEVIMKLHGHQSSCSHYPRSTAGYYLT